MSSKRTKLHTTLGLCAALFVVAATTSPAARGDATLRRRADASSPENGQCGFFGNPDMYGLGIRVGVYCQSLANLIAGAFRQESVKDIQTTNSYFRLALFVALCYLTATDSDFEPVEAAIIVLLGFCSVFYGNQPPGDDKQPEDSERKKTSLIETLVVWMTGRLTPLGLILYSVW
jgi:hypothetical protein